MAFPFGEDWDYDLVVDRARKLERVQVKYAESDGEVLRVRCRSQSLTNGKVRATKRYTSETIDWLALYDRRSERCYYVPAAVLGSGRSIMHLRLAPCRNSQRAGIRHATDFLELPP